MLSSLALTRSLHCFSRHIYSDSGVVLTGLHYNSDAMVGSPMSMKDCELFIFVYSTPHAAELGLNKCY